MLSAILGIKLDQSQQFTAEGKRIPVTFIQAGPCWVTQVNDFGQYRSYQLGFGTAKHNLKAQAGHIKKAGLDTKPRFLREVRVIDLDDTVKLGTQLVVGDIFSPGDSISITGISKGKGFAGGVKRHGFMGGPRTHGQSDRERAPGSIGQTTTPGRVYKGKRMAGRMGGEQVKVRGLRVESIDPIKNILTIRGVVPGAKQGLLFIEKTRVMTVSKK